MSKIVFITSRFPYPISKGDQLRVFFQLKSLSLTNEVHLLRFMIKKLEKNFLINYPFVKGLVFSKHL